MNVVRSFEPGLWTVGHEDHSGRFHPASDHNDRREAEAQAAYLNGGPAPESEDDGLADEVVRLQREIRVLKAEITHSDEQRAMLREAWALNEKEAMRLRTENSGQADALRQLEIRLETVRAQYSKGYAAGYDSREEEVSALRTWIAELETEAEKLSTEANKLSAEADRLSADRASVLGELMSACTARDEARAQLAEARTASIVCASCEHLWSEHSEHGDSGCLVDSDFGNCGCLVTSSTTVILSQRKPEKSEESEEVCCVNFADSGMNHWSQCPNYSAKEIEEAQRCKAPHFLASNSEGTCARPAAGGLVIYERTIRACEPCGRVLAQQGYTQGAIFELDQEEPTPVNSEPENTQRCELSEHRVEKSLQGKCTRPADGAVFNAKSAIEIPACRSCGESLDSLTAKKGWKFELDLIDE